MNPAAALRSSVRALRGALLENALEFLPARRAWRLYSWNRLRRDGVAGFNVALLAVAQGLAFAAMAGVPISHGLTCAAVASLIGPLLSSSRHTILGPTNATAFMVFSGVALLPSSDGQEMLPVLIFMAGAMLVVAAYCRLADLLQYVSRSVIVGYLAGCALLIIANQLPPALGLPSAEDATTFAGLIAALIPHLPDAYWPALAVSAATLAVHFGLRLRWPRLPTFAMALAAGAAIGALLARAGHPVDTLPSFTASDLAPAMPDLADPAVWGRLSPLMGLSFAIAFVAALEATMMAKSLASRTGDRVDLNQEVLSVGAANLATSFLSGLPASGSLTRSSLNHASGAVSQASSLIAGALCTAAAFTLGTAVGHLPHAALATLVIAVAFSLVQPRQLRICLRATRSDAATLLVTVLATLLMPLQVAIFVGVGLSIMLYLHKAARPELVEYAFTPQGQLAAAETSSPRQHPAISIVHVEGELFFGAAELFRTQIQRLASDTNLRVIILRMRNARHLDATSVMALEELVLFMHSKFRHLLISGASKDVYRVLKNSGLIDVLGRDNVFPGSVSNPNLATRNALLRAQQLLGTRDADIQILYNPSQPRE
ncbi:MAG: SulP family inorganic anion transporter [Verrucomicrobiales bacterium]